MPPTYTITAADVAAVSADSALVEGVEFDWGSTPKLIKVPSSVSQVDPQWLVDHARFAEATNVGMTRPAILTASGKVQTGTNPITGNPELTSITPVLQSDWVIQTLKTSGLFVIVDAYNPTYTETTGDFPFVDVVGVKIVYSTTRNGTIQRISGGDAGGFTSSDRATLASANSQATTAATNSATLPTIAADTAALARGNISVDTATNTLTLRTPNGDVLVTFDLTDENDVAKIIGAVQRTAQ